MMNKFLMAALLAGGALFAGCSSGDDWSAGPEAEGAQVYFSNTAGSTFTIGSDDSSVTLDVMRAETAGSLSVPVTLTTADPADAALFRAPAEVLFNDGSNKAAYTISFDRSALEDGTNYELTVAIDDPTLTTAYGYATCNLTFKVPEPFVLLGTGLFREDCITTLFSVDVVEYECEIYENLKRPGFIFLKNVYTSLYPYNDPGDYVEEDKYLEIYIADPDAVVIPRQYLGMDWNPTEYGEFLLGTNQYGTLKDGVITFPTNGLLIGMKIYSDDDFGWYANTNGMFRVALPGAVLTDYSVEIAYAGRFTDASNKNYAEAQVTGGEDVEYIEVALGAGSDPDAVLAAVEAGELETVRVSGNSGTARLPLAEDGTYTLVAVSYGGGEAREVAYTTFKFYAGTAPELSPLEKDYTDDDFIAGVSKQTLFKTWNMYARDYFGDDDERVLFNEVTFSESDVTDEYDSDYINVAGLGIYFDDPILWEWYGGVLYTCPDEEMHAFGSYQLGLFSFSTSEDGLYYQNYYDMIGAYVAEGYIAMVPYSYYDSTINGIAVGIYDDADGSYSGRVAEIYYDIMFEDPDVAAASAAMKAAATAKAVSSKELKTLSASIATRSNYVESRRGYIRSQIDAMLNAKMTANRAAAGSFEILSSSKKGAAAGRTLRTGARAKIAAVAF